MWYTLCQLPSYEAGMMELPMEVLELQYIRPMFIHEASQFQGMPGHKTRTQSNGAGYTF